MSPPAIFLKRFNTLTLIQSMPSIRGLNKLCIFLIVIILHLNIEPLILNLINVELNFEPSFTKYYSTIHKRNIINFNSSNRCLTGPLGHLLRSIIKWCPETSNRPNRELYISTITWVLRTRKTGRNLLFPCFLPVFARFWCKNEKKNEVKNWSSMLENRWKHISS